jgi:hypothetical protein
LQVFIASDKSSQPNGEEEALNLTDLVQNPHFRYLAALLRLPLCFSDWRRAHFSSEIESLLSQAMPRLTSEESIQGTGSTPSIRPIQELLEAIVKADPRLVYRSEDIVWLAQLFETYPHVTGIILGTLFAAAGTMPEMMTTVQLAALRQEPEITWRKRAQAGDIPGAYKAGNRWLLPCSTLQVQGVLADERTSEEIALPRYERVISLVHPGGGAHDEAARHATSARLEASGGQDTCPAP